MRVATAEWMAMPEDEKAKWKSLAQNDNVNFKAADLRAKRMRKKAKKLVSNSANMERVCLSIHMQTG